MAYERIKSGLEPNGLLEVPDSGPYIWGGFDALRVCTFKHNNTRAGNKANER
jgi:hypothetical protein